ncbi:POX domain [Dillenia turbinata]|uniref:POX domain n=1 Tax=Dillenia turbinata TaxID=194707 RepID=A0AAN8Z4C6_9MAGN
MGIATAPTIQPLSSSSSKSHLFFFPTIPNNSSMSQDYHQTIFPFSNGFDRSLSDQQQQDHVAQQIRRDKLRVPTQGFEPPNPIVTELEEQVPTVYEAGMLSEMFSFPQGASAPTSSTSELIIDHRQGNEWYVNRGFPHDMVDSKTTPTSNRHSHHLNADSAAAAMQLFLMNPQPRSPSPPQATATTNNNNGNSAASTLHMLLPNSGNFSTGGGSNVNVNVNYPHHQFSSEISGSVVEGGQGLSLSLSSSLQQRLEAAKAEESMLYFNSSLKNLGSSSSSQHHLHHLHVQSGIVGSNQNHQIHVGYGSSSIGVVNVLRNSKYVKAAQELLEEFCSVGRGQFKKNKFLARSNSNPNSNPGGGSNSGCGASSSSKDLPPLSAADRIEHQRRKGKLVDRRYNHYREQMQMVVNSFDLVMGFGAATPYTALAQKAMSRHFRCLKDAIAAQLKLSCELLGEKDVSGTSGVTKGETPRLKLLEQSLRQQRAFHQMGMMEQEAWRPQRGLPEHSVNVSNWFINARVRLWKPMVEEMYQLEGKDEDDPEHEDHEDPDPDQDQDQYQEEREKSQHNNNVSRTSTPTTTATTTTTTTTSLSATTQSPTTTSKRSEINAHESDPSLLAFNNPQLFLENQAEPHPTEAPPLYPPRHHRPVVDDAAYRPRRTLLTPTPVPTTADFGTASDSGGDLGPTLIRFGTPVGDVSLTLGLRQNLPEKSPFF